MKDGKGNGKNGERKSEILRLREQDWPGTVIVQTAASLGSDIDKHGTAKPFCVLVLNHEELSTVLGIIHDSKIQATVVHPVERGKEIQSESFPSFKFVMNRFPMVNSVGSTITASVACWNNLPAVGKINQKEIPKDKRPTGQRPESLVVRITAESGFCPPAVWNQMKSQPANAVRKWISHVAPSAMPLFLDSWPWELQTGVSGTGAIIKGLVRFKKHDACPTFNW